MWPPTTLIWQMWLLVKIFRLFCLCLNIIKDELTKCISCMWIIQWLLNHFGLWQFTKKIKINKAVASWGFSRSQFCDLLAAPPQGFPWTQLGLFNLKNCLRLKKEAKGEKFNTCTQTLSSPINHVTTILICLVALVRHLRHMLGTAKLPNCKSSS